MIQFSALMTHGSLVLPYGNTDQSSMVQVMGCCLAGPSHHLNHYWHIINSVLQHSSDSNFTRGAHELYYLPVVNELMKHTWLPYTVNLLNPIHRSSWPGLIKVTGLPLPWSNRISIMPDIIRGWVGVGVQALPHDTSLVTKILGEWFSVDP